MLRTDASCGTRWPDLRLLLLLLVLLGACTRPDPGLSGTWKGRFVLSQQSLQGSAAVTLTLEQQGNTVTGTFVWEDPEGSLNPLPIREMSLSDGLVAEDRVFFNAAARLPTGKVRVDYYGQLKATSLEGELGLSLIDIAGDRDLTGRLDLQRAEASD